MLFTIVLKGTGGHIHSLRFAATCFLLLCLVSGGMVMMAVHHHKELDDYYDYQ